MGSKVEEEYRSYRVVLFPAPFQGHVNPMFHLADALHAKGFSITILHALFNSPNPSNYPHYSFVPINDGVSAFDDDIVAMVRALNTGCEAPFRNQMIRMLSESSVEPITCMIADSIMYSIQAVAKQLGLPTLVLRTGSAASLCLMRALPLLWKKGYLPVQDSQLEVPLSEFPPLRLKDLMRVDQSSPEELCQLASQVYEEARTSAGVIMNTFEAIEGDVLEKIQKELSIPLFAIGPLHKLSPSVQSSLLAQDRSCLEWLDKQAPGSVMYVSFGSIATVDGKELVETAWALANSQQPFLWVVRPGSIRGSEQFALPEGFEEETQSRGKIVDWAPQQEVLAHPAVGGFWTHSGWNSTIESMCEGVPMLCWPYFGDQMPNARFVSEAWKVGVQLENGLERGEIEKGIRRLMTGKEGDEMRARARKLKEKAALCTERGGSSYATLNKLADYLMSL